MALRGPSVVSAEKRLWQATLIYALREALEGQDAGWLASPDFSAVCELAGYNPAMLSEQINRRPRQRLIEELRQAGSFVEKCRVQERQAA